MAKTPLIKQWTKGFRSQGKYCEMAGQSNQSQSGLLIDNTDKVNDPRDINVFVTNFSLLIVTIASNIWAGSVIGKKERSGINDIIICDCFINALTMFFNTFYVQSPWQILNSLPLCSILLFFHIALEIWNRLVPVGIVVFRYLMVCHAVFCHNHGGEKGIWRIVKISIGALCLLNPLIVVWNSQKSFFFLRCIGRQEAFR